MSHPDLNFSYSKIFIFLEDTYFNNNNGRWTKISVPFHTAQDTKAQQMLTNWLKGKTQDTNHLSRTEGLHTHLDDVHHTCPVISLLL